jgi:hypothetical protein
VRRVAGSYQFAHKSFFEYFCARLVLLGAGNALASREVRVGRLTRALATGRRIQLEPEVLRLLADHWHVSLEESPEIVLSRESLFEVVAASAVSAPPTTPADAVSGEEDAPVDGGAGANAATVLNWMGEPMIRQAWDGVVLEGADLTRAVLVGTSLMGASLAGVRLEKAVLRGVDFTDADLTGVEFGERAPLRVSPAQALWAMACVAPGIVAVGDTQVGLWDLVTRQTVGWPLAVGSPGVACLAAARQGGRVVLAVGCGNQVSLWDMRSGQALPEVACGHTGAVTCLAASVLQREAGDVLVVASGSEDCTVRLWDVAAGALLQAPLTHVGAVTCVAMGTHRVGGSPRSLVACGTVEGCVHVWEVGTGAAVGTVNAPCTVACVALCELQVDDALCMFMVYGAVNGSMGVWNVSTAPFVKVDTWAGHDGRVNSVAMCNGEPCLRPRAACPFHHPPPLHSFRVELRVMPVPGAVVVLSHILCLSLPACRQLPGSHGQWQ